MLQDALVEPILRQSGPGYEPWNGKRLVIVASDVAISEQFVFGVVGTETVDAIRPGISPDVREKLVPAKQMGLRFPELEFTVFLHSGSVLEVVCKALHIVVSS